MLDAAAAAEPANDRITAVAIDDGDATHLRLKMPSSIKSTLFNLSAWQLYLLTYIFRVVWTHDLSNTV